MTSAKPHHKTARNLLIEHLDIHPGQVVHADLDPAEVGIVGGPSHVTAGTSYHLGRSHLILSKRPYSVYESTRDQRGLDEYASAVDIGWFKVTTPRGTYDLRHFSRWLVGLCRAGDPDTADIREVICSLDGQTVQRFDDLGRRNSGDDSHLTHTHVSEYRDADGHRLLRLVRRYLTLIGLLAGEDEMDANEVTKAVWGPAWNGPDGSRETAADRLAMAAHGTRETLAELQRQRLTAEAILAKVTDDDEVEAILRHVDQLAATLTPPSAVEIAEATVRRLGETGPDEAAASLVAVLGPERAARLAAALTAATSTTES